VIFLNQQEQDKRELYYSYLKSVCALSHLFSDSEVPYLYYRASENIFCKTFNAENLSRDDFAYDAKKDKIGIGIKTFISKGSNNEKIAEFNSFSYELRNLKGEQLAYRLAELRNERIEFANRNYGVEKGIYHCIAREKNRLKIFETDYNLINIDQIQNITTSQASIQFSDKLNEYSFNYSKSTLFKKFYIPSTSIILDIDIIEDPFELILNMFKNGIPYEKKYEMPGINYVILPLYSLRDSKDNEKVVSERSGLNQWNARGRKRDYGEIYIPIPIQIHKNFPNYFPDRDTPFNLHVPTGEILNAKVCQENSKALMTNPNNALSNWLLRKVLKVKEGELLDYNKLKIIGIDSVRISKIDDNNFKIDFSKIGSYEIFRKNFLL